jgi:hypothetical protein
MDTDVDNQFHGAGAGMGGLLPVPGTATSQSI